MRTEVQLAPDFGNQRFRIDGGDGDQNLFDAPLILQRVVADWFDGHVGQSYEDAWLVRVINGSKAGLLLALTPRTMGSIDTDIIEHGWKSVVVHGIDFPGHDPARHGPRSVIGGMAFLERL